MGLQQHSDYLDACAKRARTFHRWTFEAVVGEWWLDVQVELVGRVREGGAQVAYTVVAAHLHGVEYTPAEVLQATPDLMARVAQRLNYEAAEVLQRAGLL